MMKVNESEMTPTRIEGVTGVALANDVVQEEVTAGVRIVMANSNVPRRPHVHSERQVIYVISGKGKITDGRETLDLKPGDFILLDANEEHYVMTENEELKLFEVKYP